MKVVLITLAATVFIQAGYFLWKLVADSLPRIGTAKVSEVFRALLSSWRWLSGLIATIVGWLLFIKATDLGDVSIVQPLMSIGDLFLILLAVVFLHERLNRREWFGLALTVVGAISLSFEAEVVKPSAIDWFSLVVFLTLAAVFLGGFLILSRYTKSPEIALALAVGVAFGVGAVLTKLMTAYISLGGQQLESDAFLFNPILPFMIAANVGGLVLLQAAFQRGRAAVIIPLQLSVVNCLAVVAGAVVFFEAISVLRLTGIALIVIGAVFLHRSVVPVPPQR